MAAANPTWHILGAGSIGCLFAAYLQRAGCAATLILRDNASLELLQQRGGIVLEREQQLTTLPLPALTAATIAQPITHLLICTKAPQTLAAINSVKTKLAKNPIIVLLQNGMGLRELVEQAIPDAIILHAITTEGAYQRERFHVVHAGFGATLLGGVSSDAQIHAEAVAKSLQCELPITVVADITQRLWLKLGINSVINPLTALHDCRNGDLLKLPDIDSIVAQLCREVTRIARAEGQSIDADHLAAEVMRVMRDTAANRSSMLQDIQARRRSEIEFINGYLVRRAQAQGLFCPEQTLLLDAVKHKEHAFT